MTTTRHAPRLGTALLIAIAATTLITGVALAHPESEGAHPSGCIVTAEPGTVASGATFTVAGNFGGASIFVLPGSEHAVRLAMTRLIVPELGHVVQQLRR